MIRAAGFGLRIVLPSLSLGYIPFRGIKNDRASAFGMENFLRFDAAGGLV